MRQNIIKFIKHVFIMSVLLSGSIFSEEYKPIYTQTKEGDLAFAEYQLRKRGSYLHDAFIIIGKIGNESHVDLLISRLKDMGDVPKGVGYVSTRLACIRALINTTKVKAADDWGINASDWIDWYENKQKRKFEYIPVPTTPSH